MSSRGRYPKLNLRSKNEIAKRISSDEFPEAAVLALLNDVLENHDRYWIDNAKASQPSKGKFVRNPSGTPLGLLLGLIDKKILSPHDALLPDFIYGGISGRSHIQAAFLLLGKRKGRRLLRMDITRFFEQISEERVFYFFYRKCGCSMRASRFLSRICSVPKGPKGSPISERVLGRGFATSTRLAVWANLDTFLRLKWETDKLLKGKDPKVAVFVDDIGISASNCSEVEMDGIGKEIQKILLAFDANQSLPINQSKTKNTAFSKNPEFLGVKLGRNRLTMGAKSKARLNRVEKKIEVEKDLVVRRKLKLSKKSYFNYKRQLQNSGNL